ncbi:contractile injection system protein, VgrG/Pvc8 family, partial [Clostridium sp. HBUAS56010]|uniref:contractile injection system protein, VgrG/Pvc8 family n=1 Tax=Clostridium sp. HBUAS56010 TaxID=2571127 RepID=UPI001A9A87AE
MEILEQGNLQLTGKECFGSLEKAALHQSMGSHGVLKALVWLQSESEWDENSTQWKDMPVALIPKGREQEPIFSGIVTSSVFLQIGGRSAVELEAYSYTILMDRNKKDRSFQQESNTYGALVRSILSPYKAAYIWSREGRDEPVGRFLMQYRESDWEFLRRIASFYGHPVVPEIRFPGAKMFIGLPVGRKPHSLNSNQYRIKKNLEKKVETLDNKTTGGLSKGLEIEVRDCYEDYCLGDLVEFLNIPLVVTEKHSCLKRGEWLHAYHVRPAQNCKMERMDNLKLAGAAIRGQVLASSFTSTRLELKTDAEEGKKESWHVQPVYYAGAGKGYSGQPEKGDSQYLYFPTAREEDRYILGGTDAGEERITSIVEKSAEEAAAEEAKGEQKEGNLPMAADHGGVPAMSSQKASQKASQRAPQAISKTKSWTTPGNQKLVLNESGVSLSNGKQTRLSVTGGGIHISSSGNLSLETEEILGHGKNVEMKAGEYVWISCEESGILLLPEEVHFKAEEIHVESPENEPHEIVKEEAVEVLLGMYEKSKKSVPPLFASDGSVVRRSGYNDILYSEELFDYFEKNVYGKGDYKNPVGHPILNYYETWLDEIYGKTKAKKFWEYMQTMDGLQDVISVVGIIFPPADLLNAVIYAARGKGWEATFSLIGALPVVGDMIGAGGKLAMRGGLKLGATLSKDGKRAVEGIELIYKTTRGEAGLLKKQLDNFLDLASIGMRGEDAYRLGIVGG